MWKWDQFNLSHFAWQEQWRSSRFIGALGIARARNSRGVQRSKALKSLEAEAKLLWWGGKNSRGREMRRKRRAEEELFRIRQLSILLILGPKPWCRPWCGTVVQGCNLGAHDGSKNRKLCAPRPSFTIWLCFSCHTIKQTYEILNSLHLCSMAMLETLYGTKVGTPTVIPST